MEQSNQKTQKERELYVDIALKNGVNDQNIMNMKNILDQLGRFLALHATTDDGRRTKAIRKIKRVEVDGKEVLQGADNEPELLFEDGRVNTSEYHNLIKLIYNNENLKNNEKIEKDIDNLSQEIKIYKIEGDPIHKNNQVHYNVRFENVQHKILESIRINVVDEMYQYIKKKPIEQNIRNTIDDQFNKKNNLLLLEKEKAEEQKKIKKEKEKAEKQQKIKEEKEKLRKTEKTRINNELEFDINGNILYIENKKIILDDKMIKSLKEMDEKRLNLIQRVESEDPEDHFLSESRKKILNSLKDSRKHYLKNYILIERDQQRTPQEKKDIIEPKEYRIMMGTLFLKEEGEEKGITFNNNLVYQLNDLIDKKREKLLTSNYSEKTKEDIEDIEDIYKMEKFLINAVKNPNNQKIINTLTNAVKNPNNKEIINQMGEINDLINNEKLTISSNENNSNKTTLRSQITSDEQKIVNEIINNTIKESNQENLKTVLENIKKNGTQNITIKKLENINKEGKYEELKFKKSDTLQKYIEKGSKELAEINNKSSYMKK